MASKNTDRAEFPGIFGESLPLIPMLPATGPATTREPIYLELSLTKAEAHTIQHALSFYSQAMHDTADDVEETIGHLQAIEWKAKATSSAAVLLELNRILATSRLEALQEEVEKAETPPPSTATDAFTAAAVRFFDNAGKGIAVFLAIVGILAALTLAIPVPRP